MDANLALNWFTSSAAAAVPGSLMNSNKYAPGLKFFLLVVFLMSMRGKEGLFMSLNQLNNET